MTTPAWNNQKEHQLIAPTDAATTALTASLDTYEADYVTLRIGLSAETSTSNTGVTISIADNTSASTTGATTVVANATIDNTAAGIHVRHGNWAAGKERYLILTVTPDTTANGAVAIAADATTYRLKEGPSATADMTDDTTNDTVVIF